jgi:glutathione S-transferase
MSLKLRHHVNVMGAVLGSSITLWRGTSVIHPAKQPDKPIQLYDMEGSPQCRSVRSALTALGLDVEIYPCPLGGQRFSPRALELGGKPGIPVLVDANTDIVKTRADAIVKYLFRRYAHTIVPNYYKAGMLPHAAGTLATMVRQMRGIGVRESRLPVQPLELWSFESSPYSSLVRERLTELELPYVLHNIGKEQFSDMGPATMRIKPGPYIPKAGGKREKLLAQLGRVQVPYLEDPNTGTKMYESALIVEYLEQQYAL